MKKLLCIIILPLPSFVKVLILRHLLRYSIGAGVRIGFSIVSAGNCTILDKTRIGHFNYIAGMRELRIGRDCIIGNFNVILGGRLVQMGDGVFIGRFNEINSILNPLVRGKTDPVLVLGDRAVVTAAHKIDFTDRVSFGSSAILAGRLSSLWTHNRQDVAPIQIGANCYLGSGIQMVPGSEVGSDCVVGSGAIITKKHSKTGVLIAGVPANVIKTLDTDALRLVTFPTRPDLDGIPESFTRDSAEA